MFQTRSEETGLNEHKTLADALEAASKDQSIWKISFTIRDTNERVRLVRKYEQYWVYEPIKF